MPLLNGIIAFLSKKEKLKLKNDEDELSQIFIYKVCGLHFW